MFRSLVRPVMALAALAGLGAYATIMLRGPQGLAALSEKRQMIRSLEEQNADLQRDIEAKKRLIERLKTDPSTQVVELERLGFVHQHDTQFKVPGQHIGPAPTAARQANEESEQHPH
ncbi:MAG: septum formation initiator family protein [Acidobacteriaceae bacterium]|nr:septum formation initiator family protein [Acidobacteriaceae bacterium]